MDWIFPQIVKNEFITQINGISLTIKREDQIHSKISGNKFRKLKYNLAQIDKSSPPTVVTFGGAYSNHLVATAAAGNLMQLKTVGFVRGEELEHQKRNPSLAFCEQQGMELLFLNRHDYRLKDSAPSVVDFCKSLPCLILPEGGTNSLAIKGCSEILTPQDREYDVICTSVGTGGTFLGLLQSMAPHQHLIGFRAVSDPKVMAWLNKKAPHSRYTLNSDFIFGGYGKVTDELIDFINQFYLEYQILLDPLYTGKLLFGIFALIKRGQWRWGKKVLVLHTGGIQAIEGFNLNQKKKGKLCIDI
ncbi:MAG: 1-aminocyclopropane-1-carboxylate deaminase/D-cysteine desulfhydrase [Flavobacteriaceae bacterium]